MEPEERLGQRDGKDVLFTMQPLLVLVDLEPRHDGRQAEEVLGGDWRERVGLPSRLYTSSLLST